MLQPRTLDEIQQEFISTLVTLNSPVNDLAPGSVLGSLVRAFSVVQLEQDTRLFEAQKTQDLFLARGSDLDYRAKKHGLARSPGARAVGNVIFNPQRSFTVIPGTLLTNLQTGLQYITVNTETISVSPIVSSVIPVSAAGVGSNYNLPAGTRLFLTDATASINPQQVNIYVGGEQRADGTYCGDLSLGANPESDDSLRSRIIESFRQPALASPASIQQAVLKTGLVDRAWVRTIGTGLAEVLVESATVNPTQLQEIKNTLTPLLPLGTLVTVGEVETDKVDLDIKIYPFSGSPIQQVDARIKTIVRSFFQALNVGEPFEPSKLQILLRPLARAISIEQPVRPILPNTYTVVSQGELTICYVS